MLQLPLKLFLLVAASTLSVPAGSRSIVPPQQISFDGTLGPPARLPDGRLVSFYAQGRPLALGGESGPEQPLFLRSSSDGGHTWSAPRRAFAYAAGKGSISREPYALVDSAGAIHVFALRFYGLPKRGDRTPGLSEVLHSVSRDGGETWSPVVSVDYGHHYTGALNSVIELKNKRLLMALSYASDHYLDQLGQSEYRVVTSYSDDGGATWQVGQDNLRVPFGPQVVHPGAIEPILIQLGDGRVWMLIRTQTLRFYSSYSSDGGKSWTLPHASRFMAPDAPGALARLANGTIVLCWNAIASYPRGVTGSYRQYLYAAISNDEGATWSTPKLLAPLRDADAPESRADYPMLCPTSEDRLLLFYYRFGVHDSATYEKPDNELIEFSAGWLAHE